MYCATFNSDARFVAGAGIDGIVRLWDTKSRQIRRTFDRPVCECVKILIVKSNKYKVNWLI